ncbi:MAG: redoxin domain-containing protein [Chloroflexi bacterium]|nr:redoxin domain-containing protein [Chloroflexota bacterium]
MTAGPVKVGDKAPDFVVRNTEGAELRLSELWSKQKSVLVFLRHFG